jgi:hypothetical protein
MSVIGIDPGLDGAIARLSSKSLAIFDVPAVKARSRGREVNLPALRDIVLKLEEEPFSIELVVIEKNASRPNEGGASGRKSGIVEGILLGAFTMMDAKILRVTPNSWKKSLRLTSDKEYSRTRAIEEFPKYHELFSLKKHHNRAEAALMTLYGYTLLKTENTKKVRRRPRLSDVL